MGITSRELAGSPGDIKINVAKLNAQELSNLELYWLENCPEGGCNEWSEQACTYYLIQRFSRLAETNRAAIRVKPDEDNRYDFIFWEDGKAIPIGKQYTFGKWVTGRIFDSGKQDLDDVVKAWEREDYKLVFSTTRGEFESTMDNVLAKDGILPPYLVKTRAEHSLEIRARNAGWPAKSVLVADYI